MKNFKEKKGFKYIMQSWPVLVFLLLILMFFAFGVFRFMIKMVETSRQRGLTETKHRELEQNKEKLLYNIENLKTDKGIEENIREKFGLVKDGEGLIIVVDSKESSDLNSENKPNWFLSLFKRWFK